MYEIASGKAPHAGRDLLELALEIRDQSRTPGIPPNAPQIMKDLMAKCWEPDPKQRIAFGDLTKALKQAMKDLQE